MAENNSSSLDAGFLVETAEPQNHTAAILALTRDPADVTLVLETLTHLLNLLAPRHLDDTKIDRQRLIMDVKIEDPLPGRRLTEGQKRMLVARMYAMVAANVLPARGYVIMRVNMGFRIVEKSTRRLIVKCSCERDTIEMVVNHGAEEKVKMYLWCNESPNVQSVQLRQVIEHGREHLTHDPEKYKFRDYIAAVKEFIRLTAEESQGACVVHADVAHLNNMNRVDRFSSEGERAAVNDPSHILPLIEKLRYVATSPDEQVIVQETLRRLVAAMAPDSIVLPREPDAGADVEHLVHSFIGRELTQAQRDALGTRIFREVARKIEPAAANVTRSVNHSGAVMFSSRLNEVMVALGHENVIVQVDWAPVASLRLTQQSLQIHTNSPRSKSYGYHDVAAAVRVFCQTVVDAVNRKVGQEIIRVVK